MLVFSFHKLITHALVYGTIWYTIEYVDHSIELILTILPFDDADLTSIVGTWVKGYLLFAHRAYLVV